jgi:hypothetical protein
LSSDPASAPDPLFCACRVAAGTAPGTAAAAAPKALPHLTRHSPTIRDLARTSPIPIRRVSPQPLAGAGIDNRVLVGASSGGAAAAAGAAMEMIASDPEHSSGEQQQQQGATAAEQQAAEAAAAAASCRPEPRRTRSVRPLRAGGGKDAANLR